MKLAWIVPLSMAVIALATLVLYRSTRLDLPAPGSVAVVGEDPESFVERREARFEDLRAGAAKTITWADPTSRSRTGFVVVYLHGFSATRQETAPLATRVAADLGANLFESRLRGHGRDGAAMAEATVADWLADVREAMAIAERLGDRPVLVGTSTGGTLALWAATEEAWRERLAALVLVSPNLGPANRAAELLLWPGGLRVAKWVQGAERTFEPQNEAQARAWTTRYPLEAVATMMRLVTGVRRLDLSSVGTPTLMLVSDRDTVIRVDAARAAFDRIGSDHKRIVVVEEVGDEDGHVLAGDVLSPGSTDRVRAAIVDFVEGTR